MPTKIEFKKPNWFRTLLADTGEFLEEKIEIVLT